MRTEEPRRGRSVVHLEMLGPADAGGLYAAIMRSQELHLPWVPPPASEGELRAALAQPRAARAGYGVRTDTGELAGVINLSGIIRGPFQSCFLSYYALVPFEGRGFMREGLEAVLGLAFGEHGLHRVEANVQPGNARSTRLVLGLGFRLEGHSPRYLRIGGEWRDHDRYALTAEEWPQR